MPLGRTSDDANRRLSSRRACLLTVTYRRPEGEGWHPAVVMDLSPNGCRIRVGERFPRGEKVQLQFEAPIRDGSSAATMEAEANVVWARTEGLSYQLGLRFVEVPEALVDLVRAVGS